MEKKCSRCGEIKALECFGIRRDVATGRRGQCLECSRKVRAICKERNPEPYKRKKAEYICKYCGKIFISDVNSVKYGKTRSCGCYRAEKLRRLRLTHGHTVGPVWTRTYRSWSLMRHRTMTPSDSGYHRYGGRGITVCDRWLGKDGFVNFLADMGERPEGMTIDRIDNDGNYEPENCRWATNAEQRRNRKDIRLLTFNGKTQCIADWALELGMDIKTLYARKYYYGFTDEETLMLPLREK